MEKENNIFDSVKDWIKHDFAKAPSLAEKREMWDDKWATDEETFGDDWDIFEYWDHYDEYIENRDKALEEVANSDPPKE